MLRNSALKTIVVLAGLSWVSLAAFQRPAFAEHAGTPPPQLTISKVVANGVDSNPTLAIEGANFGANASVYMGVSGGTLVQLTVLSATNNYINAQLTGATSAPGTYLLVVSRGPSTTDVFSIAVTISSEYSTAVQGLSGPQGRPGPTGATGPAGPAGSTGATGPQGPIGLTGAAGATGATGPMGPMGPMGANGLAGLTWLGPWNSGTAYALNDAVSYNGSSYISIHAGTNQTPDTSPTFWSVLAQIGAAGATGHAGVNGAAGDAGPVGPIGPTGPMGANGLAGLIWQGAWNSGTTYALNDAVSYNGSSYISVQAGTNQTPDTSPTFWSVLAQMGAAGATGPTGANGATGDAGPTGPTGPAGPAGPLGPAGAPGTSGPTFLVTGVTPGSVMKWWTGTGSFYTAQSFTSSGEEPARGAPIPLACNLSTIAMYASTNKKGTSDTADTITLTIYKNNVATAMACSSTSTTTLHQAVSNTCTANPVSFNVGDTLGLEWTHSNPSFTLFTQYAAGLRCQ